jgi:hypothetical protein
MFLICFIQYSDSAKNHLIFWDSDTYSVLDPYPNPKKTDAVNTKITKKKHMHQQIQYFGTTLIYMGILIQPFFKNADPDPNPSLKGQ